MASVSVGAIQLTSYVRWIVVCRLALSGGAQAGHRRKLGVLHLATVSMRTVFVFSRIKRKRKKTSLNGFSQMLIRGNQQKES